MVIVSFFLIVIKKILEILTIFYHIVSKMNWCIFFHFYQLTIHYWFFPILKYNSSCDHLIEALEWEKGKEEILE